MDWAAVYLPHLAIDAVLRQSPDPNAAIALVTGPTQRRVLHAVSPAARQLGLRRGMLLSAAQVLTRDFAALEYDPRLEQQAMTLLATWAYGYSSQVSLDFPHALVLEIAGSRAIRGDWPAIERRMHMELSELGFRHRMVAAPFPHAAHALSRVHSNAVRLDDIPVKQILTPRPVVTTLDAAWTIGEVFKIFPNLPHGRFPVYDGSGDKITGLARRRDLLKAKAENRDSVRVRDLKTTAHYVPENATVSAALHDLVRNHEQLAVVVDEFGNFSGVVTLEDIFESLLGVEIYEKDDVAVDMRELAHSRRARNVASGIRRMDASGGENQPGKSEGQKS